MTPTKTNTTKKANKQLLIPANNLKPHPSAQRKLVPVHVNRIYDNLDLDAIGVIHVVVVDEQPWIVDGQHRWHALMKHGFGDWKIRCEIHHEVTTHAEASKLFLTLNNQAVVSSFDKFQNAVTAKDPIAIGVTEIARGHGFQVTRQAGEGHITAVTALRRIYELDDGKTLDVVLDTIVGAHGHDRHSVEGKYLEGLAYVIHRHSDLDRSALTLKIAKYPGGASGILGDAMGLHRIRSGTSVVRCVSETIVEAYNRGRRGTKIEY